MVAQTAQGFVPLNVGNMANTWFVLYLFQMQVTVPYRLAGRKCIETPGVFQLLSFYATNAFRNGAITTAYPRSRYAGCTMHAGISVAWNALKKK